MTAPAIYPGVAMDVATTPLGASLCELLACVDHNALDAERVAVVFAALNIDFDAAAATWAAWQYADRALHDAHAGAEHSSAASMLRDQASELAVELVYVLQPKPRVFVTADGLEIGTDRNWVAVRHGTSATWSFPCKEVTT